MNAWPIAVLAGALSTLTLTSASGARAQGHQPGEAFRDCPICPVMVVVPAGDFVMGSPRNEPRRRRNEGPQRQIRIPGAFAIGRFEVTVGEFQAFTIAANYAQAATCVSQPNLPGGGSNWRNPGFVQSERHPVPCMRFDDALAYVRWLSAKTGETYRLPSEAEWEYAARAGSTASRYWGEGIGRGRANCDGCGSQWDNQSTAPVGSFEPNRFGLYDMLGNLWEWTADCYADTFSGHPGDGSAFRGGRCKGRVMRGGSFESDPRRLRAASRAPRKPHDIAPDFGFRVVREIREVPPAPPPVAPPVASTPPAPPAAPAPSTTFAPPPPPPPAAPPLAKSQPSAPPPSSLPPPPSLPPSQPPPSPPPATAAKPAKPAELPELPPLPPLPPLED